MIDFAALGFSRWLGLRDGPVLDAHCGSTRPGVYVVGDLADAPVLKAALAQGWQTGQHLADQLGATGPGDRVDVVIIGAGPGGALCAAAIAARGLRYALLDAGNPFQTLAAFPRGKVLYAEPRDVPVPGDWPFDDAVKEVVVARWRDELTSRGLTATSDRTVEAIEGVDGDFTVRARDMAGATHAIRGRVVVVAIGRRGAPRKLGVPGESRARHDLDDPARYAGRDVVIAGGGDSAAEFAVALADAGAHTTLVHRGATIRRPKPRNRTAVARATTAGTLTVLADAQIRQIAEHDLTVVSGGETHTLAADAVFVAIGTDPPYDLLEQFGIGLRSDAARERRRLGWITVFILSIALFYVLKQHREVPLIEPWIAPLRAFFTVTVPGWPTVDGAPRVFDPGFWGTLLYSAVIAGFGAAAIARYRHDAFQVRRYLSLIAFQVVFLFGIPELVAPALTATPSVFYTLSVPWPLSIWSLGHGPSAWPWLVAGAVVTFVAIPLFVRRFNESFCSWMCGCGGLAETLGDLWRDRAPRGDLARKSEWAGVIVLLLAIPTTLLILNDAWGLVGFRTWMDQEVRIEAAGPVVGLSSAQRPGDIRVTRSWIEGAQLHLDLDKQDSGGGWANTGWTNAITLGDTTVYADKLEEGHYVLPAPPVGTVLRVKAASSALSTASSFARGWYSLMVDFWLAAVIGVAMYPLLGNRVWCRFFCPLRAYMEMLSKRFGQLAIRADDRCISCGECTRACQMGIDVQGFAEQGLAFDNATSACIQCGICVTVCPMDVLSLGEKPEGRLATNQTIGPRWG